MRPAAAKVDWIGWLVLAVAVAAAAVANPLQAQEAGGPSPRPGLLSISFGGPDGLQAIVVATVANDGAAPFMVLEVGPAPSPFTLADDGCTGQTVLPGAYCQITVTFGPPTGAFVVDGIDVQTDAGPLELVLFGLPVSSSGVSAPLELPVEAAPGLLGETPVVLWNTGASPVDLGTAAVAPAVPWSLSADACSGQALPPGGHCSLTVGFTPEGLGEFEGSLSLAVDQMTLYIETAGESEVVEPVLVTPRPGASVYDLDAFTVRPLGTGTFRLKAEVLRDGVSIRDFSSGWSQDTVRGGEPATRPLSAAEALPPGEYTWRASALHLESGQWSDPSDEARFTVTPPPLVPEPSSVTFGDIYLGDPAATEVAVRNPGSTAVSVTSVAVDAPFILQQDGCSGRSLAPGDACTLTVSFSPSALVAAQGNLLVRSPESGDLTVPLSGAGVLRPPTLVAPGPEDVAGPAGPFLLENPNPVAVTFSIELLQPGSQEVTATFDQALSREGWSQASYAAQGRGELALPPGQALTPGDYAWRAYAVALETGARSQASPELTFTISTGRLASTPDSITIDESFVNEEARATIVVRNTGGTPARVTGMGFPTAEWRVAETTCARRTLGPGEECQVVLAFIPTRTGSYSSSFTLQSSTGDLEVPLRAEARARVADLAVSGVTGPDQATAGETVRVQWTVTNRGAAPAAGPWHDALFLVPLGGASDQPLPLDNLQVAEGVTLLPGESTTLSVQVRVPGVVPGDYRWRVVANVFREVDEPPGNENNARLSAGAVPVDLAEMTVDGPPVEGHLSAEANFAWFRLEAPPEGDLSLFLDLESGTGVTELYAQSGMVGPLLSRWNYGVTWSWGSLGPDSSLKVPAAAGAYFVTVEARGLQEPSAFTLQARSVGLSLAGVSPSVVGNSGPSTLRILGDGLRPGLRFVLEDSQGQSHEATAVYWEGSSVPYATFDLAGAATGPYHLRVLDEAGIAGSANNVLRVREGEGGKLTVRVSVPSRVRAGRQFTGVVYYRNEGDADVVAPILLLTGGDLWLRGQTPSSRPEVQLIASQSQGPAGILPPASRGSIVFHGVLPQEGQADVQVFYKDALATEPMDWAGMEDRLRPSGADLSAWQPVWDAFVQQAGNTWGGYVRAVAEHATEAGRQGERSRLVRAVLTGVFQEALRAARTNVAGRVLLSDGRPLPGALALLATPDGQQAGAAVTESDGSFALGLPPGQYTLEVPGYLITSGDRVVVPAQGRNDGIEAVVEAGGAITGLVSSGETGAGVAEVPVFATASDGRTFPATSGSGGGYRISGLPQGTYTVRAGGGPWAVQAQASVAAAPGETARNINFPLERAAALRGRVVRAADGSPVADALVSLRGPGGQVASAATDAGGEYVVEGLAPGQYTGTVSAAGYAPQPLPPSTLAAGEAHPAHPVSLAPGASLSVTLRDQETTSPLGDAVVTLHDPATGELAGFALTDASGRAALPDLAPGEYRAVARSGGRQQQTTLSVSPGGEGQAGPPGTVDLFLEYTGESLFTLPGAFWGDLYHELTEEKNPEPQRAHGDSPGKLDLFQYLEASTSCTAAAEAFVEAFEWATAKDDAYDSWVAHHRNYNGTINNGLAIFATDMVNLGAQLWSLGRLSGGGQAMQTDLFGLAGELSKVGNNNTAAAVSALAGMTNTVYSYFSTLTSQDYSDPGAVMQTLFGLSKDTWGLVNGGWSVVDSVRQLRNLESLGDLVPPAVANRIGVLQTAMEAYFRTLESWDALMNAGNTVVDAQEHYREAWLRFWKARQALLQAIEECEEDDEVQEEDLPDPPDPSLGGSGTVTSLRSYDPNDKLGVGIGPAGFVPAGQALLYTIRFENLSSAGAPAQEVRITDRLDPSLDWATVEMVGFGFNTVSQDVPPGRPEYATTVRVPTDPNPVHVEASLDPATGVLTWYAASVDPFTGMLPEDPLAGFLPPNDDSHRGEGYVTFLAQPRQDLTTGAAIHNAASIVFDVNDPIETNQVVNTIDAAPPSSQVDPLPGTSEATFLLSWSDADDHGSGIDTYDIYVSMDGGPFRPFLQGTTDATATFQGEEGRRYAFYSVARDRVGNIEVAPATPDAVTQVATGVNGQGEGQTQASPGSEAGPQREGASLTPTPQGESTGGRGSPLAVALGAVIGVLAVAAVAAGLVVAVRRWRNGSA